jgi:hypothetical protein
VSKILDYLPKSPRDMVAVHVRLGDYLLQRGNIAGPRFGWALPKAYYQRALEAFPKDCPIALFSDDIRMAIEVLPRRPVWVSSAKNAAVDLFLMSAFKQVVIANSSLSWWAAWLNNVAGRLIVAPEYHIGWHQRRWYPQEIKVDGWIYV